MKNGGMTAEKFCAELGREIRQARVEKRMSQEELAGRVGLHRNSVARYEAGADIPIMIFVRLCLALEIHAKEVLDQVLGEDSAAVIRRANGL